jgi:hypothetical protein
VNSPNTPMRIFRLRVSLRAVMLIVGALCFLLGWWVISARRQQAAVAVQVVEARPNGDAPAGKTRPSMHNVWISADDDFRIEIRASHSVRAGGRLS